MAVSEKELKIVAEKCNLLLHHMGYKEKTHVAVYNNKPGLKPIVYFYLENFLDCEDHKNKKNFKSLYNNGNYSVNYKKINNWLYEFFLPILEQHPNVEIYTFYTDAQRFYGLRNFNDNFSV